MNLEATRLRGRPRNRWQDEGREDGIPVGGKWWKEGVYNREKWKKLLRTARNRRILHMLMQQIFGVMISLRNYELSTRILGKVSHCIELIYTKVN